MTIERLHSGPRMSQAVIHNGLVYLAGQIGAPGEDTAAQTRAVLDKIDALLAEAGTDKSHVLTATIWLADMSDFGAMNEISPAPRDSGALVPTDGYPSDLLAPSKIWRRRSPCGVTSIAG